jgi:hypothetical protein
MPELHELLRELADAQQEARNLTVMAMNPKYTPKKRRLFHDLERSARAEVRLRMVALKRHLSIANRDVSK